jgi:hypothetical protein
MKKSINEMAELILGISINGIKFFEWFLDEIQSNLHQITLKIGYLV